jgi:hypothetical protein
VVTVTEPLPDDRRRGRALPIATLAFALFALAFAFAAFAIVLAHDAGDDDTVVRPQDHPMAPMMSLMMGDTAPMQQQCAALTGDAGGCASMLERMSTHMADGMPMSADGMPMPGMTGATGSE